MSNGWPGRHWYPYLIAGAVLYAGWVKFLFEGTTVYFLDYAFRFTCVTLILLAGERGIFRFPARPQSAILPILAVLVLEWAVFRLYHLSFSSDPWLYNQLFPDIESDLLLYFDLTFGLALVAVSEEAVFRHLFARAWAVRGGGRVGLYGVSSIIFALLHAPQGLASVIAAFFSGIILMWLYRKTASLWPPMIAHYLVNLALFTDFACWIGVGFCRIMI